MNLRGHAYYLEHVGRRGPPVWWFVVLLITSLVVIAETISRQIP